MAACGIAPVSDNLPTPSTKFIYRTMRHLFAHYFARKMPDWGVGCVTVVVVVVVVVVVGVGGGAGVRWKVVG